MKKCKFPGCDRPAKAFGYCDTHYQRIWRNGTLELKRAAPGECAEWLLANYNLDTDECIIWPFGKWGSGYGQLNYLGKAWSASKLACTLAHGEAPEGMEAAHSCGNRACINARHLRWATHKENEQDKIEHGTKNVGERNGLSRFSEQQILEIYHAQGLQKDIAKRFGTTADYVSKIKRGCRWSWLTGAAA